MMLVLILGGVLGWEVHRARVQRDAVSQIKRVGGHVFFDWQVVNGNPQAPGTKPRGAIWLRDLVGPDYFDTAVFVVFAGPRVDDSIRPHVSRLSDLQGRDAHAGAAVTLTHGTDG